MTGRFTQPDTIVPSPQGVQAWDRFAYVNNNPVKFIDPSGHRTCSKAQAESGDETCDENIVDGPDRVIHRKFMGAFAAAKPVEPTADLPSKNPRGITNIGIWILQALGVVKDLAPAQAPKKNVFTYLTYSEYYDGNVDNFSISVINNSDQSAYLSDIAFATERWDADFRTDLPSCVECGIFVTRSTISDHLATMRPHTTANVDLTTYPSNPAISITPYYGFPPFSGNINITVIGDFFSNTSTGFNHIRLMTKIMGPRWGW